MGASRFDWIGFFLSITVVGQIVTCHRSRAVLELQKKS